MLNFPSKTISTTINKCSFKRLNRMLLKKTFLRTLSTILLTPLLSSNSSDLIGLDLQIYKKTFQIL